MHFMLQLMIHLTVQSRSTPEGTFDGAPKEALSDLHKDAQKGACEIALLGALQVALPLHLWFHWLMQCLMHKCAQNGSSNGGPDAKLEGALNMEFEWASYSSLWKQLKMHNKVAKRTYLTFFLTGFALKYEHVSVVEGVPYGSSEATPTFEVEIKSRLEFTMELHLRMHILERLLMQKSPQNDSIKGELEEALNVALEGAPKISL